MKLETRRTPPFLIGKLMTRSNCFFERKSAKCRSSLGLESSSTVIFSKVHWTGSTYFLKHLLVPLFSRTMFSCKLFSPPINSSYRILQIDTLTYLCDDKLKIHTTGYIEFLKRYRIAINEYYIRVEKCRYISENLSTYTNLKNTWYLLFKIDEHVQYDIWEFIRNYSDWHFILH